MIPIIRPHNEVVGISPEAMAVFAAFANHLSPMHLGINCAHCLQPLRGNNAGQDKYFSVTCGCREFRTDNPNKEKSLDEVVADAKLMV